MYIHTYHISAGMCVSVNLIHPSYPCLISYLIHKVVCFNSAAAVSLRVLFVLLQVVFGELSLLLKDLSLTTAVPQILPFSLREGKYEYERRKGMLLVLCFFPLNVNKPYDKVLGAAQLLKFVKA